MSPFFLELGLYHICSHYDLIVLTLLFATALAPGFDLATVSGGVCGEGGGVGLLSLQRRDEIENH